LAGSTLTRTAGSAPPPTNTWPTPSTWESFCWSTVEATSYMAARVTVGEVSARTMTGASAGFILR